MTEFVFWAALAVLAYTYVGFPSLIWMLAQILPRAVRRSTYQPRVAVIIVARNEAASIGQKIESCLAQSYSKEKLRIVVASDGSDDETNERVTAYAARGVTLLAFPVRRGKASCLNDVVASCDEEVVVLTDARQRLDAHANALDLLADLLRALPEDDERLLMLRTLAVRNGRFEPSVSLTRPSVRRVGNSCSRPTASLKSGRGLMRTGVTKSSSAGRRVACIR